MKLNMSPLHRIMHLVFSAVIVVLYFTHVLKGAWGIALMILAGIAVLTSFISFYQSRKSKENN